MSSLETTLQEWVTKDEPRASVTEVVATVLDTLRQKNKAAYKRLGRKFKHTISRKTSDCLLRQGIQALGSMIEEANPSLDVPATELEQNHKEVLIKTPWKATALVVAQYEEDRGVVKLDNHNALVVTKTIALGWVKAGRMSFKLLRHYAGLAPETKHLAALSDEVEHRDYQKFRKIGGYLKQGEHNEKGWVVRTIPINLIPLCGFIDHSKLPTGKPNKKGPKIRNIPSVKGLNIRINAQKNALELTFPKKPRPKILKVLKRFGLKYNKKENFWYTVDAPETRQFAHQLKSA